MLRFALLVKLLRLLVLMSGEMYCKVVMLVCVQNTGMG
jgi:hypothetical protein